MLHKVRWTTQKITQRLALIEPLVYRRSAPLPPFRYVALPGPMERPALEQALDDSDWTTIEPHTYWGTWVTDFVLQTQFDVPRDWDADAPVALFLPLGEAGDFSHPEALVYIDGASYAGCDRHHREIRLPTACSDGGSHLLALHGWTGNGGSRRGDTGSQLYMRPCQIVQIDQPARDFIATVRVALGIAKNLDENEPAKAYLLNALDESFKILDTREPFGDALYASVAPAHATPSRVLPRPAHRAM